MRVISRRALREFWDVHPAAEEPLKAWFRVMESGSFTAFSTIKKAFGAADYLAPYTIFDVGGNKYRLITVIHYNRGRTYVRHVFTHAEYDRWSDQVGRRKRRGIR